MKRICVLLGILAVLSTILILDRTRHVEPTNTYSTNAPIQINSPSLYYQQRASLFERLGIEKQAVVFVGDSITDGCEWNELLHRNDVINRGINGDTISGVSNRIDLVMNGNPKTVFLMIGINDLTIGTLEPDQRYKQLLKHIQGHNKKTHIVIQSILPVNQQMNSVKLASNEAISKMNVKIEETAREYGMTYIDLHKEFTDNQGNLGTKYTNDGLHLNGFGYEHWATILESTGVLPH